MNATASTAEASSLSVCPLCCEENLSATSSEGVVLSTCHHRSCRACLAKWVEKEETSGQTTLPTCPFCRSEIGEDDVFVIVGRPFQPRETAANGPNGDGEIDELTLQWINEHTVPCRGCGSLIEKADGCDKIECLCGYRFCFRCGSPGAACGCNPGHWFLNSQGYIADEPVRDGSGHVDLRLCILRRKVRQEREHKRAEMSDEEWDRWDYSEKKVGTCTSNGRWLYCPKKSTGSIYMLAHQLKSERANVERESKKKEEDTSNASHGAPWLFLQPGADIRALGHFIARDDIQKRRLGRHLTEEIFSFDRASGLGLVWLFLPDQTGLRILKGMNAAMKKRSRRLLLARKRAMEDKDASQIDAFINSGAWLFQKSIGTQGHLAHLYRHSKDFQRKKLLDYLQGRVDVGSKKEEEEKECIESILIVFPRKVEDSEV